MTESIDPAIQDTPSKRRERWRIARPLPSNTPDLPRDLVHRPRLHDLISQPYQATVTTIVAPPGYGKTVLAVEWAARFAKSFYYVRFTTADNDPICLTLTIQAAIAPGSTPAALETSLAEWIKEFAEGATIVLDDCHLVRSLESRTLLNQLLDVPANYKLLILGRTEPDISLNQMRMLDEARTIVGTELAFTLEEAEQLALTMGLDAGSARSMVKSTMALSSGWPALVHLAVAAGVEAQRFRIDAESRENRTNEWLDSYLNDALFSPLSDEPKARLFVRAMVKAIARSSAAADDAEQLAQSVGSGIDVYSTPAVLNGITRLAARYPLAVELAARTLMERNDLDAAVELASKAGLDFLIEEVGLRAATERAVRSDLDGIASTIDRLPESLVANSADLTYMNASSEILRGRIHTPRARTIDRLEALRSSYPDTLLFEGRRLLLDGARAFYESDDAKAAEALARALELLPPTQFAERQQAATFLELTSFRLGDDVQAAHWEHVAISCASKLPIDELWSWRMTSMARANAYVLRGDVGSAITKYRVMLAELPANARFLEGFMRCRLVSLWIERADLSAARREIDALEQLKQTTESEPTWIHHFTLAKMRLLAASGRTDEAEQLGVDQIIRMRRRPEKSQLVLLLANLWLHRGDRAMVRSWLDDVTAFDYPAVTIFGELNYREVELDLALSEHALDRAVELGEMLFDEARAKHRVAEEIRFAMRLAVAHHLFDDQRRANELAASALDLAKRGGFLRSLLVPGFDVESRFASVWSQSSFGHRVCQQLHAISESVHDPDHQTLSPRERELLRLVALGRSNQQIAADLFISANTVRNHLVRINQRLHARSRVEAVARARELGLIG